MFQVTARYFHLISCLFMLVWHGALQANEVYWGGVAFAGNYSDFPTNYPNTYSLSQELTEDGQQRLQLHAGQEILGMSDLIPGGRLKVGELASLQGQSALVLALLIDGEHSSEYRVAGKELGIDVTAVTADLSALLFIFDYDSKTLVSSYPIRLRRVSALNGGASNADFLRNLYRGFFYDSSSDVYLFSQVRDALPNISLRAIDSGRLQVSEVVIEEKADKWLPDNSPPAKARLVRSFGASFTQYLAENTQTNVLPYLGASTGLAGEARNITNTGAALGGAMAMRFSNGDVFNLAIPEPDYELSLVLRGFSKSKGKATDGAQAWIYGTYLNVKCQQPALNKTYFDENLKNVYVEVMVKGHPPSPSVDWRSFSEATHVLLEKITLGFIVKPDNKWVKAHGSGKQTSSAFAEMSTVMKKCKR